MINIEIYKLGNDKIYGFKAQNHGKDVVCSAVSALAINAVNAIEKFAGCELMCEYEKDGGFLFLEIPDIKNGKGNKTAELLLDSLLLGLMSVKSEYEGQISLVIKEVQ